MHSVTEALEREEVVEKLRAAGHSQLLEILLNDPRVYTKKGRLNKSGACRALGWKAKQLEEALFSMRETLAREFD